MQNAQSRLLEKTLGRQGEGTWTGDLGPPGATPQLGCSLLEKYRFELNWLV